LADNKFTPKDFKQWEEFFALQEKVGESMRKNMTEFNQAYKDVAKVRRTLEKSSSELQKTQEQIKTATGEELKFLKEKEKRLKNVVDENKAILQAIKEQTRGTKGLVNYTVALGDSLKNKVSKGWAISSRLMNTSLNTTRKLYNVSKRLFEEYSKQEDSIRRMAIDVGITGRNQELLRKTLYKTATANQRLGLSASETAQIYGSYVENVGRLIPLSEQASYKLAEMAKGTALGAEGTAQMAGNMEVFGMSIDRTAGYVEDVANMSEKMGVNSGKVLKALNQNMRQAAAVRFKDGVAGIAKMAALSTKLRLDMSSVLGLAQDLWEPEKAIETAANLQMMGGAFARMGDPLRLMFLGRNNPTELLNNLADAAASVAKRGSDGTYEIPTMELQKLKQVAESTGLDFQNLVETARTAARQKDIGKMLSPNISDEAKEYISSIAQWSDKDGGFVIETDKGVMKVSEINKDVAKTLTDSGKTLRSRAEEAQSFLSYFRNVMESFKNLAFSFISGVGSVITEPLKAIFGPGTDNMARMSDTLREAGVSFGNWLVQFIPMVKGFVDKASNFITDGLPKFINKAGEIGQYILSAAKKVGEFLSSPEFKGFIERMGEIAKTIISFGKKLYDIFGPSSVLLVMFRKEIFGALRFVGSSLSGLSNILGGMFKRRVQPIEGSVHVTNMPVGGVGGGSVLDGGGYGGGKGGKMGPATPKGYKMPKGKGGMFGNILNVGKNVGSKGIGFLSKGMRAANPYMWAGLAADVGRGFLDDQDSALGKSLGIAGSAATGAAIGSFLGPIGTAVGGLVGGIYGAYNEFTTKGVKDFDQSAMDDKIRNTFKQNLAGSTTMMADGALLPDGNVIKTAKGKMYNLSPKDIVSIGQPGSNSNSSSGGSSVNVNIGGTIMLSAGGTTSGISLDGLLKDPTFVREITKLVVEQTKNMNR